MPTDYEENTLGKNKGGELLLTNKPQTFPKRRERTSQENQRKRKALIHWSTLPQGQQNKTKKPSYGVNWPQKGLWYGPAKLYNRLPQNVQNIRRSHKVYREYHVKLESGIDSRSIKLSWGENQERDVRGRCVITITICNWDDDSELHT